LLGEGCVQSKNSPYSWGEICGDSSAISKFGSAVKSAYVLHFLKHPTINGKVLTLKYMASYIRMSKFDAPVRDLTGKILYNNNSMGVCGGVRLTRIGPGTSALVEVADVVNGEFNFPEMMAMGDYLVEFSADDGATFITVQDDFVFNNPLQAPEWKISEAFDTRLCPDGTWKFAPSNCNISYFDSHVRYVDFSYSGGIELNAGHLWTASMSYTLDGDAFSMIIKYGDDNEDFSGTYNLATQIISGSSHEYGYDDSGKPYDAHCSFNAHKLGY